MLDGLFIVSHIATVVQLIKEAAQPVIPAENWANKELIHQDRMRGITQKEFKENLANGRYKLIENYPKPHKNKNGQIIIENCRLYKEDCRKYNAVQVMKWVKEGKYNLTQEELRKEKERLNKKHNRKYIFK